MKAILIDAVEKTVTEVEYDGELDTAYRLLRCELIDAVNVGGGNVLLVDDEGLLTSDDDDSPFFLLDNGWVFAGSGLIVGDADENGNTTATTVPLSFAAPRVKFATRAELRLIGVNPQPSISFDSYIEGSDQ